MQKFWQKTLHEGATEKTEVDLIKDKSLMPEFWWIFFFNFQTVIPEGLVAKSRSGKEWTRILNHLPKVHLRYMHLPHPTWTMCILTLVLLKTFFQIGWGSRWLIQTPAIYI